jgi:hypothetical protein
MNRSPWASDLAAAGDESADFLTKVLGPVSRNLGEWLAILTLMGSMISSGYAMMATAGVGIVAGLLPVPVPRIG